MSGATKIEWTDATWNPFRGCSRISPGCQNCYAERLAARFSYPGGWGERFAEMTEAGPRWTRKVSVVEGNLDWPIRYKGHPDAIEAGRPTRIFVNSTSDIAHETLADEDIDAAFAAMVLAQAHGRTHNLTYHLQMKNRKGGDPSEWPEDLRVQEYPRVGIAV